MYFFFIGTESSVNKLSVISQRENVLSAIGTLSRSPSTNISQEDILKLFEKYFYSMIQQEVHEGLISNMLQQMTGWCARLTSINQTLTEFFKVILSSIGIRIKSPFILIGILNRKDLNKKQVQPLQELLIYNVW